MTHLDEGTIHAWLDGALTADEGAKLEAHVASCVECRDRVAEARGLIAASSRILASLDHVPALGSVATPGPGASELRARLREQQRPSWGRRLVANRPLAAAATIAFLAVGTAVVTQWSPWTVAMDTAERSEEVRAMSEPQPAEVVVELAQPPADSQPQATDTPARGAAGGAGRDEAKSTSSVQQGMARSTRRDASLPPADDAKGAASGNQAAALPPAAPAPVVAQERRLREAARPETVQSEIAARKAAPQSLAATVNEKMARTLLDSTVSRDRAAAASSVAPSSAGARVATEESTRYRVAEPLHTGCYSLDAVRGSPAPDLPTRLSLERTPASIDTTPALFAARALGGATGSANRTLAWRPIDSSLVELVILDGRRVVRRELALVEAVQGAAARAERSSVDGRAVTLRASRTTCGMR